MPIHLIALRLLGVLAGGILASLPHALVHEVGHLLACRVLAPGSPVRLGWSDGWVVTRISEPDTSNGGVLRLAAIAVAGPLASVGWCACLLWLLLHLSNDALAAGLLVGALLEAGLSLVRGRAPGEDWDHVRAAIRRRRRTPGRAAFR